MATNFKVFFFILFCAVTAHAEDSWNAESWPQNREAPALQPGNPPELRICSQNLNNLGVQAVKRRERIDQKTAALVDRFKQTACDVIALQEVGGSDLSAAKSILKKLGMALEKATGRKFAAYVGEGVDRRIRNGFLIADDAGDVQQVKSFAFEPLPKLQVRGPSRRFSRGPLAVILNVKPKAGGSPKTFFIITLHFKSQADGWRDPTNTMFETQRMEQAEGLRRIVERETLRSAHSVVPVILGDRNSPDGTAVTDILTGRHTLSDYSTPGLCALDLHQRSACVFPAHEPPTYVGLLSRLNQYSGNPIASYRFRGKMILLDEIFVRPQDIGLFSTTPNKPVVGVAGNFDQGSDHKLVWTEANW